MRVSACAAQRSAPQRCQEVERRLSLRAGFEKPSAIQQKGIVPFTKGLDVIQQAQSGTGKTATFCAGILNNIDYDLTQCQALVLAPTRELAQQIDKVMNHLGEYLNIKSHACVGGTSVREDTNTLQKGVHVVVGTPGRVFDMLRRGALRAESIKMFTLDEADEMLSRGFKDQIYDIFRMIPGELQVRRQHFSVPAASPRQRYVVARAACVCRARQAPWHARRCAASGSGFRAQHSLCPRPTRRRACCARAAATNPLRCARGGRTLRAIHHHSQRCTAYRWAFSPRRCRLRRWR